MYKGLSYSVYVSRFEEEKDRLALLYREGSRVFTSFHISEEMDGGYAKRAYEMCGALREIGYSIMGDVSKRTLDFFAETDITRFARRMGISILRIDYGFSPEEIAEIGAEMPVCVNASTIGAADAAFIRAKAKVAFGLHNFYPRPETGLDDIFFDARNRELREAGLEIAAFIPGGPVFRGPLFAGLPTLEKHRGMSPYAAYIDTLTTHGVDNVFIGDGIAARYEAERVDAYLSTGILDIPVVFRDPYSYLYGTAFTVRVDSPARCMRMQESREYATPGASMECGNCVTRERGAVTMDNKKYLRYSGEIQIIREASVADERVNVIGAVPEEYILLLDNCANGKRLRFVEK